MLDRPEVQIVTINRSGVTLATDLDEARGVWGGFKGLMFRKVLPRGHGLLFRPAQGVHTQFMRFPIDLVFFDENNVVTKIHPAMPPWRFDLTMARGVIELNAGAAQAAGLLAGDQLRFEPAAR